MLRMLLLLMVGMCSYLGYAQESKPVRVGVVGLVHTHVHLILGREDKGDIEIVAIVEPNRQLAERYARQHGFSMEIVYDDLETMLDEVKPEAVTAFNTIKGHLEVVRQCAPRRIHVMVEKPLAVSLSDAKQMKKLAEQHDILLLTNYETTWYPTTYASLTQVGDSTLGTVRKIVVHDGHQGPEEIGVNEEFLEWLIDPEYNGAGALTDFGCYGANLITRVMNNQKPTTVTAVTQNFKPEKYPLVEDEATIILTYPEAQGIIQASWNWTFSRKDLEVYGTDAYLRTVDQTRMYIRNIEKSPEIPMTPTNPETPYDDPFSYLSAAVRGEIEVVPHDLSSLENNMIVMEILTAAMRSVKEGRSILIR